jgi:hypothetical protein
MTHIKPRPNLEDNLVINLGNIQVTLRRHNFDFTRCIDVISLAYSNQVFNLPLQTPVEPMVVELSQKNGHQVSLCNSTKLLKKIKKGKENL